MYEAFVALVIQMKYFENIVEIIGNTPSIRLKNILSADMQSLVLVKVESFNTGGM
jgi:cystathionine beta-synthase